MNSQQPPRQAVSVVIHGHDHSQPVANGHYTPLQHNKRRRLLNVDEALQFSPLTTSPAIGVDRIPLPQIGSAHHESELLSADDKATVLKSLEDLKGPKYGPRGQEQYKRAVREVQDLLSNETTSYRMKPRRRSARTANHARSSTAQALQLSPFAKKLFESVKMPLEYASVRNYSSVNPKTSHIPVATQPTQVTSATGTLSQNKESFHANTGVNTVAPLKVEPRIVVETLTASETARYVPLPDSPKRRKLDSDGEILFQKEGSAKAVEKLQELLFEIFEEEDHLQPDTSMDNSRQPSALFDTLISNEDGTPRLSVKAHERLYPAISKVVALDQIQNIPLDYLKRLQRLCEEPVTFVDRLDLDVRHDLETNQIATWQQQLRIAENDMAAASTFMNIALGNLHEKELFPEEMSSKLPRFLQKIIEDLIIPVAELRSTGKTAATFTAAKSARDHLLKLVTQSKRFLKLFTDLHMKMKDTEYAINAVVSLGPKLISVESASAEKDSVLGPQNFERLRKAAMGVMAKVFARYQEQQHSITEGLLDSLSKLPTAKQGARQYKLTNGKSIQLVSALFMQLVQATATAPQVESTKHKAVALQKSALPEEGQEDDVDSETNQQPSSIHQLRSLSRPLVGCAHINARRIVQGFLRRAMESKRSGDDKHRNLLDLFIEDLIVTLNSPEWPAAEVLLRFLTSDLFFSVTGKLVAEGEEIQVPTIMALEILGWVASAILNMKNAMSKDAAELDFEEQGISFNIQQLVEDQNSGGLRPEDFILESGPFPILIQHLNGMGSDNWQVDSAKSLYILQWAELLCTTFGNDVSDLGLDITGIVASVRELLINPAHLETEFELGNITAGHGRLAHRLVMLNSGLCKYFNHIIRILINSINSDQVKTRSRSLKSIVSLLEVDPNLLDKEPGIMKAIFRCTTDPSPMVRDSALSLIGKYISITPKLLDEGCHTIFRCFGDSSVGVRKKCINLSRDIYRTEQRQDLRIAISDMILQRIQDPEDSVSGLARQTLEELWLSELTQISAADDVDDSARAKVAVSNQTEILVRTLQRHEHNPAFLESFLRTLFKDKAKAVSPLEKCCKAIVSDAFDKAVTLQNDRSPRNAEYLLQTLTVFGKARPRLIDSVRLEALLPYLGNLKSRKADEGDKSDDLSLFQSVVSIFHSVIPHLSAMAKPLLVDVQRKLFESIPQLPKQVLDEVTACLWTIHSVLRETVRFTRLAVSVLKNGLDMRGSDLGDAKSTLKLRSYIRILGSIGKSWDLESQLQIFKRVVPTSQETSVAGIFAEFCIPFTTPGQPLTLRAIALDSLGSICLTWPGQLQKPRVQQAFLYVFSENISDLQDVALKIFAEFFGIREYGVDTFGSKVANDDSQDQDLGRLGGSLKASEHDGAAAIIGAQFLQPIITIATRRLDQSALTATRVIASINRQGLIHPKECASALVALETSTNVIISKIAVDTHRSLHQQHESMFEREYMKAVYEAFFYQKNVIGDASGANARPYVSKLRFLFDIVKMSNTKYVKKFLSNLVSRSTFDLAKLGARQDLLDAVLFARFVMQNIAFLEYGRVEDLIHVIGHMEGVIGKLGVDIAQNIESQILYTATSMSHLGMDGHQGDTVTNSAEIPRSSEAPALNETPIDRGLLQKLTAAAMILSTISETQRYLKRQYGISRAALLSHDSNEKTKDAKELGKVLTKVHGVTGDRYWEATKHIMSSLDNEDSMKARCQEFVILMSVDDDVKVTTEDGHDRHSWSASAEYEEQPPNTPSSMKGSKGKRKSSVSLSGTPRKKRGRPSKSAVVLSDDSDGGWD